MEAYLSSGSPGPEAVQWLEHHFRTLKPVGTDVARGRFLISRHLDQRVRNGELALQFAVTLVAASSESEVLNLPWTSAHPTGRSGPAHVELKIDVPSRLSSGEKVTKASAVIVPAPATP